MRIDVSECGERSLDEGASGNFEPDLSFLSHASILYLYAFLQADVAAAIEKLKQLKVVQEEKQKVLK